MFLRNLDFVLVKVSYHFCSLIAKPLVLKTEGWADPTANLDVLEKRRNSCLFQKSIPTSLII
jgi:hypothetical protein